MDPVCCAPLAQEPISAEDAAVLAKAFKAIGDPVRLRLLSLIASRDGETCVCDLTAPFELTAPTISHHVAGFVDAYLFQGPAGIQVTIPCIVLVADATTVNPCALAGGTFVSRTLTLVDQVADEQTVAGGPVVATVRVCQATLTATVLGFGVNSAPAFTLC